MFKNSFNSMIIAGFGLLIAGLFFLFRGNLDNAMTFLVLFPIVTGNSIDLKTAPKWVNTLIYIYSSFLLGLLVYIVFRDSRLI